MALQEERSDRPLYLVTGMLKTKDPVGFFQPFAGLVRHVATIPLASTDAYRTPEDLVSAASGAGLSATAFSSLEAALADVRARAGEDGVAPRVLICGSLYLAGEILSKNGMRPV